SFVGTLGFLPPEQARAEEVDARSDLFQVGALLYWGLCGQPPNGTGSPGEILARAAAGHTTPIGELRADLPPPLARLIDKALSKDPAMRFGGALEMRSELREILRAAPESGS